MFNIMRKIFKYILFDLLCSWWMYFYFGFFLVFSSVLFLLSGDFIKVIVSLMNVILIFCLLIVMMFGVMYCYNFWEFIELFLVQFLFCWVIFWGQYLGVVFFLLVSLLLGIGFLFFFFGLVQVDLLFVFLFFLVNGVVLFFIFLGLVFFLVLCFDNKICGFGMVILLWLFFVVIYDGLLLLLLFFFWDYLLENLFLGMSLFNFIDLF